MTDTTQTRQYSRRTVLRRGAATVATTVGAAGLAGTATAESDDLPHGVLADGFDGGDRWAFFTSAARSQTGRLRSGSSAEILADRIRNEFNANADAWLSYGNWMLEDQNVSVLGDATVAVDVTKTSRVFGDDTVATTLEVDYDGTEFTALEWYLDDADDPDYRIEVRDYAAENAADELQTFRREYIGDSDDDHELPDETYVSELAGKYWTLLSIGDEERSVLELLLGEIDG